MLKYPSPTMLLSDNDAFKICLLRLLLHICAARRMLCKVRMFPLDYALLISSLFFFSVSMCYTPGPNNAIAMSIGMEKGFRAALPFSFGGSIGGMVQLLGLGLGLTEVFTRFPLAYEILRYLGAVYMLWLAWKISGLKFPINRGTDKTQADTELPDYTQVRPDAERKPMGFTYAFLFQLLNVKVWLTNIVIASSYVGMGDDRMFRLVIASGITFFNSLMAMFVWVAGGVFMRRFLTSEGLRRANYVFAVFLVISVALLFV